MDDSSAGPDDRWAAVRDRDAQWVAQALAGDPDAFGRIYDAWFDRVYDVVLRIVRNPDTAAECAQDAFLNAWRTLSTLQDHRAFGGWLLRIARNAALNRSERERRSHSVDDEGLAMIESYGDGAANAPDGFRVEDRLGRAATPELAVEDGEVRSLVWEAAGTLGDRDLEVLDLSLRHGLTPAEIGEVVGLNRNAANQLLHRVRARLEVALRARVLWRGGQPQCEELARRLDAAGITAFDAEAVRIAERHVPGCATCDERQRMRLQPSALFASVPIVMAPIFFKQQAAAALEVAGVPMGGSAFGSGAATGAAGSAGGSTDGASGQGASGDGASGQGASGAGAADQGASGAGAVGGTATVHDLAAARNGRARRTLALLGAAAVILVLLIVVLATGTQDGRLVTETAGGPATTGTVPATTAAPDVPATGPTTEAPTTVTTASVPTSDVPTTPPTTVPLPPTTEPSTSTSSTTTTAPPPVLSISIAPGRMTTPWKSGAGPVLTWSVESASPVTVEVVGPEATAPFGFRSTAPSGTHELCPGTAVRGLCTTTTAAYRYELVVTRADGTVDRATTAFLVEAPPVVIR